MPKSLVRPLLLIVVPCLAIVGAAMVWLYGGRHISTENAYVKSDIARISAEVTGRIKRVVVSDHERVRQGELLLVLDDEPFQIAVAKAKAEVDTTRHRVATLVAEWSEAKSELKEAEDRIAYQQSQLERNRQLAERKIVSSSRLEEAEDNTRQAKNRVAVMQSKVRRMLAQLGGNPSIEIDDHPEVREKLAALREAKLNLRRTTITAPVAGVAVNVKVQPGEFVEPDKPLFALVVSSRPWVEANFKETELTHIRRSMKATVVLDIYPDVEWQAEVASISPATGAEFALLPPQNASGNWVKVVQRLPVKLYLKPMPGEPPLRAGMTAAVSVDTRRERKLSHLLGVLSAFAIGKEKTAK
ncbi:MAG: HlyD family secretion protein [Hyphomicrobiaceae bacterium]